MKKLNETRQIMDMWRKNFVPSSSSLLSEGMYDDAGIGDSGFTTVGDARSFLTDFENPKRRGSDAVDDEYHGGSYDDEFDYQESDDYEFGGNTLTMCSDAPESSFCYAIISKGDSDLLLQLEDEEYGPYDNTIYDDVEILDCALENCTLEEIRNVLDRHNVSYIMDGSSSMYDSQPVSQWIKSIGLGLEEDYYDY
jgi:hypothetical protein